MLENTTKKSSSGEIFLHTGKYIITNKLINTGGKEDQVLGEFSHDIVYSIDCLPMDQYMS